MFSSVAQEVQTEQLNSDSKSLLAKDVHPGTTLRPDHDALYAQKPEDLYRLIQLISQICW